MPNHLRMLTLVLLGAVLFSCAPPTKVDVVERVTVNRNVEIDRMGGNLIRHVAPGDTLYSIAFEMGLDAKEIAAWNGVDDTTKLPVGKRIRLTKPINFVALPEPVLIESTNRQIVAVPINEAEKPPTQTDQPALAPPDASSPNPQSSATAPPTKVANVPSVSQAPVLPAVLTTWSWPIAGKVVRNFSQAQGRQGIDIQGEIGQAVLAANAGVVVYVGNSLKGYGNLVIIKHNEVFLSAYAHNTEIYVREGEQVNAGQRVASVGTNWQKQTALHFQIRKNGQPVNPLAYLTKQG